MPPDIYYCIPAYNEEGNIMRCLAALAEQDIDARVKTLIGLSECTDNTENEIYEAVDIYPSLDINIINCDKGKTCAQNEIVKYVENRNVPLLFIDADITLDEKCVDILYKELCELDQLIVVGGWPVPIKPERMSVLENFLYHTLHARALYPEAEISKNDVSKFKNYVKTNPQPTISDDFENKSKIGD